MSTRSTKCNKSTVICDVSTAQCEHGTIKCDILVTWYSTVELLEIKRQESKVHKSKRM